MNASVDMINRLETVRRQLEDQRKANAAKSDVVEAIDAFDKKLLGVELRLVTRSDLLSDDKYYMEAYKVYLNLIWLSGEVGTGAGDVAGGADQRPTDASLRFQTELERQIDATKAAYKKVMTAITKSTSDS